MKGKILYILTGVLIGLGLIFTRPKGLDEDTRLLIDEARTLDTDLLFPGFDIRQYPMDVNYGGIEYRYYNGKIKDQEPLYPLALSAVPSEEGPVVKVIPLRDFRSFYDMGGESKDQVEKSFISVLAHEAFHCHQMDKGYGGMAEESPKEIDTGDFNQAEAVLLMLDEDASYQDLWTQEMDALVLYRDQGDRKGYLRAKKAKEAYLSQALSKEDYKIFSYYIKERELIEGTARFAENKVLDLYGLENNSNYDGTYYPGPGQMYTSGALKAQIIEGQGKLDKINFDLTMSLEDLL